MEVNSSTRILITGCAGMLGDAFYRLFNGCGTVCATDIVLSDPWLERLDVRDRARYTGKAASFGPDIIMHLAANTDQEYCEKNSEEARATNAVSVENAVLAARETGAELLYVSTSSIFDGLKESYEDWDSPNPLSVYGRTKLAGEAVVRNSMERHFICRPGWMMGGGPGKDSKFVNKILRLVEKGAAEISAVADKFGSPTYTHDFARNVYHLIKTGSYGTYNMAGRGGCSRYALAEEILSILNKKEKISLVKVDSGHFETAYFARRPASEVLANTKLEMMGLNKMRHWREALRDYINASYSHLID